MCRTKGLNHPDSFQFKFAQRLWVVEQSDTFTEVVWVLARGFGVDAKLQLLIAGHRAAVGAGKHVPFVTGNLVDGDGKT